MTMPATDGSSARYYDSAVGTDQYHKTYGYDWLGNLITHTVGGKEIAYTYRRRDGLTLSNPTLPITDEYQIYLPLVAQNYDPQLIQQPFAVVATSAGFRVGYDRNGNMLVRVEVSGTETLTYTQAWDVENRLSVVTNTVNGAVTRFVYDVDGTRVLREDAGGLTIYVGAVEVAISGTQRLTTSYYFAGGQRVALREGVTLTYLHGDHLGSASLATDNAGAQVSALRYTPFGETRYGDAPTDFRFTGQREEEFGLYDYGARVYSPGIGRFVSADMVVPDFSNPQSLNRYTYILNNALKYIDPYGFEKVIVVYGSNYSDETTSFYEAALTQYRYALAAGYSEEDTLFLEYGIETDAELLDAIRQSDVGEIEYLYIFAHGWKHGIQLSAGRSNERQFMANDLDSRLADRFSSQAEIHIRACQVGRRFASNIAYAFDVTTYASSQSFKFWYETTNENGESGWQQYHPTPGQMATENTNVEMFPYLLGDPWHPGGIDLTTRYPQGYRAFLSRSERLRRTLLILFNLIA